VHAFVVVVSVSEEIMKDIHNDSVELFPASELIHRRNTNSELPIPFALRAANSKMRT
jgi:hypothetical protein